MILRLLNFALLILIAGCGGGGGESVGESGGPSTDQTAGLTFSFVRAQASLEVPATTVSLRFDFFTGPAATGASAQDSQTRAFANQITIHPVSLTCRSVKVTALSGDGRSLLFGVANVTPILGQVSQVLFSFSEEVVYPSLTTLRVTPDGENLGVGGQKRFAVHGFDQYGQTFPLDGLTVVWSSSEQLAIEPTSGLTRALSAGAATVTATIGSLSSTVSVNVFQPGLDSIVLVSPELVVLRYGVTNSAELTTIGSFGTAGNRQLTNADDGLNYFVSGAPDVVEVTSSGEITALAVGETVITASAGQFSQTVQVQVEFGPAGNLAPNLTLQVSEQIVPQDSLTKPFESALLSDDQASMSGGRLTVRVDSEQSTGLALNGANGLNIGETHGTEGSDVLVVDLDARATTKQVATFLRSLTISSDSSEDPLVEGTLEVLLDDGKGQSTLAHRRFVVVGASAQILTVFLDQPVSATNFHTIRAALAKVSSGNGSARGSLVTVGPGNFSTEGRLNIETDSDFAGLRLRGANAGNSVGALEVGQPESSPTGQTEIGTLSVRAPKVTVDGFCSGVLDDSPDQGVPVVVVQATDFTLANCNFRDNAPHQALGIYSVEGVDGVLTIRDSRFDGFQQALQCYRPASTARVVVSGNIFVSNLIGAQMLGLTDLKLAGNSFRQSQRYNLSIDLQGRDLSGLSGNDFSSGSVSVYSSVVGSPVLNITGNWWGQQTGPQDQILTKDGVNVVASPSSTTPLTNG